MKRSFYALGRLPKGVMNKTETAYSVFLQKKLERGEILFWKFEAITLKLAKDTRLTPDFLVLANDGQVELHDTKGSKFIWTDDSKVKMKVAAEMFPFRFLVAIPKRGEWEITEVGA